MYHLILTKVQKSYLDISGQEKKSLVEVFCSFLYLSKAAHAIYFDKGVPLNNLILKNSHDCGESEECAYWLISKGSINEVFYQGHDLKSKSQRLRGYIIGIVRPTLTNNLYFF